MTKVLWGSTVGCPSDSLASCPSLCQCYFKPNSPLWALLRTIAMCTWSYNDDRLCMVWLFVIRLCSGEHIWQRSNRSSTLMRPNSSSLLQLTALSGKRHDLAAFDCQNVLKPYRTGPPRPSLSRSVIYRVGQIKWHHFTFLLVTLWQMKNSTKCYDF